MQVYLSLTWGIWSTDWTNTRVSSLDVTTPPMSPKSPILSSLKMALMHGWMVLIVCDKGQTGWT